MLVSQIPKMLSPYSDVQSSTVIWNQLIPCNFALLMISSKNNFFKT